MSDLPESGARRGVTLSQILKLSETHTRDQMRKLGIVFEDDRTSSWEIDGAAEARRLRPYSVVKRGPWYVVLDKNGRQWGRAGAQFVADGIAQ